MPESWWRRHRYWLTTPAPFTGAYGVVVNMGTETTYERRFRGNRGGRGWFEVRTRWAWLRPAWKADPWALFYVPTSRDPRPLSADASRRDDGSVTHGAPDAGPGTATPRWALTILSLHRLRRFGRAGRAPAGRGGLTVTSRECHPLQALQATGDRLPARRVDVGAVFAERDEALEPGQMRAHDHVEGEGRPVAHLERGEPSEPAVSHGEPEVRDVAVGQPAEHRLRPPLLVVRDRPRPSLRRRIRRAGYRTAAQRRLRPLTREWARAENVRRSARPGRAPPGSAVPLPPGRRHAA
jgi:hypothetical protein